MKIDSLKDLEKLVKLCRKVGIDAIKIDNIEFALAHQPTKLKATTIAPAAYAPGGITEDTRIDMPDELTQEQLLMWSAGGGTSEVAG